MNEQKAKGRGREERFDQGKGTKAMGTVLFTERFLPNNHELNVTK